MSTIIRLEKITKTYLDGRVIALNDISLDLPRGKVGLLGPNGAGKTTMIKILLGLLEPDQGRIYFNETPVNEMMHVLRQHVGYVPENNPIIKDVTGVRLLVHLGRISGLPREEAIKRAHEVLLYVGLKDERYRKIETYSTGMIRRLLVAQSLIHNPQIIIMDEPTNGCDPASRRRILELIKELHTEFGKDVILSTHLLFDVEETCDEIILINNGQIIAQGNIKNLLSMKERLISIHVNKPGVVMNEVGDTSAVRVISEFNNIYLLVSKDDVKTFKRVMEIIKEKNLVIYSIEEYKETLENLFIKLVGGNNS